MIRPGTLDDSAAIAEIFNHYVRTSTVIFSNRVLSAEDMHMKLESVAGHFPFLVWEEDGRVTGYCYAHFWHPDPVYSRTWELTEYLAHDFRGRGVGRTLLEAVIEQCREAGAHTLISCITAGNEPCERMCRRLGFELRGVFPAVGYKFNQYLDDAIYQLML